MKYKYNSIQNYKEYFTSFLFRPTLLTCYTTMNLQLFRIFIEKLGMKFIELYEVPGLQTKIYVYKQHRKYWLIYANPAHDIFSVFQNIDNEIIPTLEKLNEKQK